METTKLDDAAVAAACFNILGRLGFSTEEQVAVLGFPSQANAELTKAAICGIHDRIELVFDALSKLHGMFDGNIETQCKFFDTAQKMLENKTARTLLASGDEKNIICVASLINRVTG
jgi:hypothetical protein